MSETLNQSTRTQKEEGKGETSREKKEKTPATIRLCNGEIYFIKDVGQAKNKNMFVCCWPTDPPKLGPTQIFLLQL